MYRKENVFYCFRQFIFFLRFSGLYPSHIALRKVAIQAIISSACYQFVSLSKYEHKLNELAEVSSQCLSIIILYYVCIGFLLFKENSIRVFSLVFVCLLIIISLTSYLQFKLVWIFLSFPQKNRIWKPTNEHTYQCSSRSQAFPKLT